MFTGIIEETGTVRSVSLTGGSGRLDISAHTVLEGTKIGDSIAVNGVCLTVVRMTDSAFTADVMAETVRRSSLAQLHSGSRVNLERAVAVGQRMGGHILTGHIDGTGVITSMRRDGNATWVTVRTSPGVLRLICEKGSIAIDGISLTVAGVGDGEFSVSIIPHTGAETTLLNGSVGRTVNLENDIIAKYIDRLMTLGATSATDGAEAAKDGAAHGADGGLTLDMLRDMGF